MTKSNGEFHGQFKATVSCDGGTAVIRAWQRSGWRRIK